MEVPTGSKGTRVRKTRFRPIDSLEIARSWRAQLPKRCTRFWRKTSSRRNSSSRTVGSRRTMRQAVSRQLATNQATSSPLFPLTALQESDKASMATRRPNHPRWRGTGMHCILSHSNSSNSQTLGVRTKTRSTATRHPLIATSRWPMRTRQSGSIWPNSLNWSRPSTSRQALKTHRSSRSKWPSFRTPWRKSWHHRLCRSTRASSKSRSSRNQIRKRK